MENLLRKHSLVRELARYDPRNEVRRDIIAELLDDTGRRTLKGRAFFEEVRRRCSQAGIPAPKDVAIQVSLGQLRWVREWITNPTTRKPKNKVPSYCKGIYARVSAEFPVGALALLPTLAEPHHNGATGPFKALEEWIAALVRTEVRSLFSMVMERLDQIERRLVNHQAPVSQSKPGEVLIPTNRMAILEQRASEEDVVPPGRVSRDLPVVANNGFHISYTTRFFRSYKRTHSGMLYGIVETLKTFAEHGESYPGLSFKKLQKIGDTMRQKAFHRTGMDLCHMRVNKRIRILVNRNSPGRAYLIEKIVHHDEIE